MHTHPCVFKNYSTYFIYCLSIYTQIQPDVGRVFKPRENSNTTRNTSCNLKHTVPRQLMEKRDGTETFQMFGDTSHLRCQRVTCTHTTRDKPTRSLRRMAVLTCSSCCAFLSLGHRMLVWGQWLHRQNRKKKTKNPTQNCKSRCSESIGWVCRGGKERVLHKRCSWQLAKHTKEN